MGMTSVGMTSRERVVTALNHEEPDRVPLDIGGGTSSSIVVEEYENLKMHLGVQMETKVWNRVFRVAHIDNEVRGRLGADCVPLGVGPPQNWSPPPSEPGSFIDLWGLQWKETYYSQGCFYYELMNSPLADASILVNDRSLNVSIVTDAHMGSPQATVFRSFVVVLVIVGSHHHHLVQPRPWPHHAAQPNDTFLNIRVV